MNIGQFDIINPLDGIVGQALHGPMHRFPRRDSPLLLAPEVEMILRQYGVRVWGREMKEEGDERC